MRHSSVGIEHLITLLVMLFILFYIPVAIVSLIYTNKESMCTEKIETVISGRREFNDETGVYIKYEVEYTVDNKTYTKVMNQTDKSLGDSVEVYYNPKEPSSCYIDERMNYWSSCFRTYTCCFVAFAVVLSFILLNDSNEQMTK